MAKTGNPPPSQSPPSYERKSGIEPVNNSVNFGQAFSGLRESMSEISLIGNNIAKNVAIERATLDGIKAGNTPGRKLMPGFTQSTKAFNDAYLSEEYNTLVRESEKYLNSSFQEASKNPTTATLNNFEKNAKIFLDSQHGLISEVNKSKFSRDIGSAYESRYYQLSNLVDANNKKMLRDNFKSTYKNYNSEISDLYAAGNSEAAANKYKNGIEFLNQQKSSGIITPAEYSVYHKALSTDSEVSKQQSILMNKINDNKGAEYLSEWAEKPNTEENIAIKTALYKQYNQYNSLKGTKSHIAKTEGIQKANEGTLTEVDKLELTESMTESDVADFNAKISKISLKKGITAQSIDFVEKNKDNVISLSNAPPKAIDAWYDKQVDNFTSLMDSEPTIKDRINMANQLNAPVPKLNKQVEALIMRGNGQDAIDAMIAYSDPTTQKALTGVSEEAEARALHFMDELNAGNDPQTALKKVNYARDNLTPGQKEQWDMEYKEITDRDGKHDLTDSKKLINETAQALNYPKGDIPSGLPIIWKDTMKRNYKITGNWDRAAKMTKKSFDNTWGYSYVNGKKELMFMPPEKFIRDFPVGADHFRNQIYDSFKIKANEYKELYDKYPEQDFYYEPDVKEIENGSELSPSYKGGRFGITEGGEIRAKKIFRDGTVQKGRIVIQSDRRTLLPQTGMTPNYYIGFASDEDDVVMPVKDPSNQLNPLRYVPDIKLVQQEIIKKAKSLRREALNFTIEQENEYLRRKKRTAFETWAEEPEDNPYGY